MQGGAVGRSAISLGLLKGATVDRERAMREAIHSGEMEGAWVSEEFRADAEAYIAGEIAREELVERTRKRWAIRSEAGSSDGGLFEFRLDCAVFAGMIERRSWLSKLLDSLTLMKGDERVEPLEEAADLGLLIYRRKLYRRLFSCVNSEGPHGSRTR